VDRAPNLNINMVHGAHAIGHPPTVCGNIDPVSILLRGTPEEVYTATQRCLTLGGCRCISAAGCEIPQKTPSTNLEAQFQALQEFEA